MAMSAKDSQFRSGVPAGQLTPYLFICLALCSASYSQSRGELTGVIVTQKNEVVAGATVVLSNTMEEQRTVTDADGNFHLPLPSGPFTLRGSRTDGPFLNPLRYKRDNVTGNYTWKRNENEALGFKLNLGRNDFDSSGQIPQWLAFMELLDTLSPLPWV